MKTLRTAIKKVLVAGMGSEVRPRRVLRGLASGCRILVSPTEHLGYLLGTAEPHLQRAIRKYVKRGDTAYDIGANLGYVSLSLSTRVGNSGKVFAFEPLPDNIVLLRKGIEASGRKNVTVFDFAASDVSGTAVIRMTGNNRSMASLVWHQDEPTATEYTVRTEPIDEHVESYGLPKPSFVKIDVEGAEGKVLRGMSRTIARFKPVIFIECSDAGREITWAILKEIGYRCESAVTGRSIEHFEEYRHSDFLWVPSS